MPDYGELRRAGRQDPRPQGRPGPARGSTREAAGEGRAAEEVGRASATAGAWSAAGRLSVALRGREGGRDPHDDAGPRDPRGRARAASRAELDASRVRSRGRDAALGSAAPQVRPVRARAGQGRQSCVSWRWSRGARSASVVGVSSDQSSAPYFEALVAYAARNPGRFHIPGHKGGPGADPAMLEAFGAGALAHDIPSLIEGIDVGARADPVRARAGARRRGLGRRAQLVPDQRRLAGKPRRLPRRSPDAASASWSSATSTRA